MVSRMIAGLALVAVMAASTPALAQFHGKDSATPPAMAQMSTADSSLAQSPVKAKRACTAKSKSVACKREMAAKAAAPH